MKTSAVGDLTRLAKDLERVFAKHCTDRAAFAIAFTLAPGYDVVHWVTNVSRTDGINLLRATAAKMRAQTN